ncbi:unnamed protein product [Echinostoma caproni]|uniref:DUF1758 domain-containing protein n=1 Tax=Echinostoma caproni TaxID=27848 RepID=A0A182ZZ79_9TREM|nr:unnamed protein product [Echinostoma caproni]
MRLSEIIKQWPHLADFPVEYFDGEVLLLIGCDVPEAHWVLDQRLSGRKNPYSVWTLLSWVIFGPSCFTSYEMKSVNCLAAEDSNLINQIMQMHDAEFTDAQLLNQGISVDYTEAMATVDSGTMFVDGHFVVPLPWRNSVNTDMGNYESALSRLNSLKHRLINDKALRFRYAQTMKMTKEKRYAVPVSGEHCDIHPCWYLPHHAVLTQKKPEKVRVVLDCAAKHKGLSLNDMFYQGPDTTANLVGILLRFRTARIAVTADIEKMFMQVKVPNKIEVL